MLAFLRHRWPVLLAVGCLIVLVGAPTAAAAPRLPSPAGWPVGGRPRVVAGFDPPALRWLAGHRGVDLAARPGDPVLAAAGGRVSFAGRVAGRSVISIDHGDARTTYEPVEAMVVRGQPVAKGQLIGRVAAGGHCDGRCLHWGLRDGEEYLNPLLLLRDGSTRLRLTPEAHRAEVVAAARSRSVQADHVARVGFFIAPPGPAGGHGFLRPVPGGITSPYGMRFHPVLHRWKLHDGTDFGAGCGTPIRAPYAGVVRQRYYNAGYGNRLILDHGRVDGRSVRTAYNHAIGYSVGPGDHVRRNQVIGQVGSTGYSTGCHLHLMVWLDGAMVNPMTWF